MKKLIIGTIVLIININPLNISPAEAHSKHKVKKTYIRSKRSNPTKTSRAYIRPNHNWTDVKEHVAFCESKGNYNARNRRSTASGKYQFLNSTWAGRYGVKRAYLATPEQQEQAALELHAKRGLQPWRASRGCWGRRI